MAVRVLTPARSLPRPQVVSQLRRRLGTTVEEDASRREHQGVLRERQERAAAERLQLDHKVFGGGGGRVWGRALDE